MFRPSSLLAAVAVLAAPSIALACGGLFCGAVQLQPVQQNGERILFEINGDGTITTTVEINYTGDPDEFSWVVPVPTTPSIDVDTPSDVMSLLDDATKPQIIPPPTKCTDARPPVPFATNDSMTRGAGGEAAPQEPGVNVEDIADAGPYTAVVVSSDDPDELITWLNEHDYLITAEMEPFVAHYVEAGMKFLAVQLQPATEASAISPLGMTYVADEPMIPIQLTAVGAEPEMGVMAFVVADSGRYESTSYENLVIDTADVRLDPRTGVENYYPLLSWKIDEAGGRAVVTQFADQLAGAVQIAHNAWDWDPQYEDSFARLDELASTYSYVTRLYTRISATEMTGDPSFGPSTGDDLSPIHDLSDQPEVEVCAGNGDVRRNKTECGDMYCGPDAQCAVNDDWGEGCVCPVGTTARMISEPRVAGFQGAVNTVVCESTELEFLASIDLASGGAGTDPCLVDNCGSGECVALNGFATCRCDEGFAAVDNFEGGLVCVQAQRTYAPDRITFDLAGCACQSTGTDPAAAGLAALLLGLLGITRRR